MSLPPVSIVLVTRNGARTLPATLAAIAGQRTDFGIELIAVDSGSEDGTLELLERAAAQVVRIPPRSFNHGATRNLGVERARGELVVFLAQDALPLSDEWLTNLTAPLRTSADVAGAFCRQQPRHDATRIVRHYLNGWVAASPTPRSVKLSGPRDLDALDPLARLQCCAFDNVCSCIRRSVWREIPFADTSIGEDIEWGRAVLLAGYRIDYVTDAAVLHSHERSAWYEFARTYALHRRLWPLFGLRTIPSAGVLLRAVASSARLHLQCEREAERGDGRRAGLPRALALALAWPLGQYLGGLSAAKGWRPLRLARV